MLSLGCFSYVIIHPVIKFPVFFVVLLVNDDVVVHQTMTNNYLFSRELFNKNNDVLFAIIYGINIIFNTSLSVWFVY